MTTAPDPRRFDSEDDYLAACSAQRRREHDRQQRRLDDYLDEHDGGFVPLPGNLQDLDL